MPTPYNDVALLLRRAGFGGTPNEISALALLDLPQVVDRLLDTSAAPPVVIPAAAADSTKDDYWRWVAAIQWWCDRMATTPAPLAEKMVLFWHGHFTSSLGDTNFMNMWDQSQLFRTMGLGNFTALAQAVAINPAMLEYLDNRSNVVGRPNENFARELMELFTLGVNQYTQADVVAAARAWTGHGTSSDNRAYVFRSNRHDNNNKTFFGVTKNWNGPDIINEICTGQKRMTMARFISRKLWSFFAYENPPTTLVDELAAAFVAANLNIESLLRTIFLRPEFYSTT